MSAVSTDFPVPEYLRASSDVPERWLEALPRRVAAIADRWHLRLDVPFEPGGNCSWVAPAVDDRGRDVVLKVAWVHTESRHEAEGLAALGGDRAVEVHAFEHVAPDVDDDGTTAMLLERCWPGNELRGCGEDEQHDVIVDMLQATWAVELDPEHPFRPLSEMADQWVTSAEERLADDPTRLDAAVARDGFDLFRDLARPGSDDVLLLTDLHAGNVLSSQRRPWLLVDPKPYVGDRHYDVLQHVLNCVASLHTDPVGLLTEVARRADLDLPRLRQWLFARLVVEALGQGRSPFRPVEALRRLGGP